MTVVIQNSKAKASTNSQQRKQSKESQHWSLQQKQQQQSLKKKQEAAMKFRSVFLHSKSTSTEGENRHNNNSCYYPDCKKNANCNCEICLDSINATLDLMPMSIHKNSLTKLSVTRPPKNVHCTPINFNASILSTPTTTSRTSDWPYQISPTTPVIDSSAGSSDSGQKIEKQNKGSRKRSSSGSGFTLLWILLGFGFLLSADIVFSWVVSGILQPSLSPDVVKRVGEKCYHVQGLNGKLRLLQRELTSIVVGKVSNCSFNDTLWKVNRDGLLLSSRCTLYKSAIEEVTIWGWPLQTAGLLTNGFSTRTQTILSGRVTEWNGGLVGYLTRKANTSWVQPKWGASVVQLDPNTWVLEYQRSSIVDGKKLYSVVLEFLKYWISRVIGRLKKKFWRFAAYGSQYNRFKANNGLKIPT